MQNQVSQEEFRWNFKRLLREGHPDGLPISMIEEQYKYWFGKVITPHVLWPEYSGRRPLDWNVLFGAPAFKFTFVVCRNKKSPMDYVRLTEGPELSLGELRIVLKMSDYSNYSLYKKGGMDQPHAGENPNSPDSTGPLQYGSPATTMLSGTESGTETDNDSPASVNTDSDLHDGNNHLKNFQGTSTTARPGSQDSQDLNDSASAPKGPVLNLPDFQCNIPAGLSDSFRTTQLPVSELETQQILSAGSQEAGGAAEVVEEEATQRLTEQVQAPAVGTGGLRNRKIKDTLTTPATSINSATNPTERGTLSFQPEAVVNDQPPAIVKVEHRSQELQARALVTDQPPLLIVKTERQRTDHLTNLNTGDTQELQDVKLKSERVDSPLRTFLVPQCQYLNNNTPVIAKVKTDPSARETVAPTSQTPLIPKRNLLRNVQPVEIDLTVDDEEESAKSAVLGSPERSNAELEPESIKEAWNKVVNSVTFNVPISLPLVLKTHSPAEAQNSTPQDVEVPGPSSESRRSLRPKRPLIHKDEQFSPLAKQIKMKPSQSPRPTLNSALFNSLVDAMVPGLTDLVYGTVQEPYMTKDVLERHMDVPMDWVAFPVQGDHWFDPEPNRGFYKSQGSKPLRLGVDWTPYNFQTCGKKTFELPHQTLVYGEFVVQAPTETNTKGSTITVFHIMDVAILDGVDISKLPFTQRYARCSEAISPFNSTFANCKNKIHVKMKPFMNLLNMEPEIFDKLIEMIEDGEQITCLTDPMEDGTEPLIKITGIVFMKSTLNMSDENFQYSMNNRYYWHWTSDLCLSRKKLLDDNYELGLFDFLRVFREMGALPPEPAE